MDLKELDIKELKALCYEQIKLLKQTEINIQIIEQEINKKEKEQNAENNN